MEQEEKICVEKSLYQAGICLPLAYFVVRLLPMRLPTFVSAMLSLPCVFHTVTGYYCPGCGGTRAVKALVQGNVLLSFCYHPVVVYAAVLYLCFMATHTIEKISGGKWKIGMPYRNGYLYAALAIVALNVVVKNIALAVFQLDLLKILEQTHVFV